MKHQAKNRRATAVRAHKKSGGFTLVELLVVLAIIGILASILFPVFARVQETGRSTVCQSNLKQLGLAFQQYQQDTGGRLPGAGNWQNWGDGFPGGDPAAGAPGQRGGHWVAGKNTAYLSALDDNDGDGEYPYTAPNSASVDRGALFQYVKQPETYYCPSNEDAEAKKISYGMNCALSGATASRVRFPSSMVLLVDEWRASDAYFWAVATDTSTDTITKDHNATGNILFMDGHVRNFSNDSFVLTNNKAADVGAASIANKSAGSTRANEPKTSNAPRFHDVTLGFAGSNYPTPFQPGTDSCLQAPPTTTTPVTPTNQ